MPWIEVKPYQDGWHIYMDFREDIKRRADYLSIKRALELVTVVGGTKNPKTVARIRGNRRPGAVYLLFNPNNMYSTHSHHSVGDMFNKYFGRYPSGYYRAGYPPVLGRLSIENWEKENANVQKWFYKVVDTTKYWGLKSWYQANFPTYWMVVKTRPAIVTHVKDIDPELEKRYTEVESEMNITGYKYGWHYGGSRYKIMEHYGEKGHRAAQRAVMQKVLKGEIEEFEFKRKIRNYD